MLKISSLLLNQIMVHGEKAFPEECVGVLFGKSGENEREVAEIFPVNNSAQEKRTEFSISAQDLLKAEKTALSQNLDIIGFYHSHADFEAVASEKDKAFALPLLSYPIVQVKDGKAAAVKSFAYSGGLSNPYFSEEEIICL